MLSWLVWAITKALCRLIFAVLGGFRVEGRKNVPAHGAVLICPNHLSHLDPPVVGVALRRRPWYMATDELFAIRGIGSLARALRAFPVHQDSPDRAALRTAEGVLKRGEALVVFPEGHESLTGELQPIQPGVIMVAVRAGVPIVPVGILGTDAVMAPASFRLHRSGRPLRIRFGEPIPVQELTGGLKGRAGLDRGAERLQEAIAAVLEEMTGEAYPRTGRAVPVGAAPNGGIEGYNSEG